jgi:hypothetical protein
MLKTLPVVGLVDEGEVAKISTTSEDNGDVRGQLRRVLTVDGGEVQFDKFPDVDAINAHAVGNSGVEVWGCSLGWGEVWDGGIGVRYRCGGLLSRSRFTDESFGWSCCLSHSRYRGR